MTSPNIANIGIHVTIGELYFTQYNGHWVQAASQTGPGHTLASTVNIFKLLNFDFRKLQGEQRGRWYVPGKTVNHVPCDTFCTTDPIVDTESRWTLC